MGPVVGPYRALDGPTGPGARSCPGSGTRTWTGSGWAQGPMGPFKRNWMPCQTLTLLPGSPEAASRQHEESVAGASGVPTLCFSRLVLFWVLP